jgi:CIC family chloride channel protein
VGSYLGYVFSKLINLTGLTQPVSNFTMVGMAGILSGLFHASNSHFPYAEITGGYSLMLPLMIVASISFAISKRFEDIPWM